MIHNEGVLTQPYFIMYSSLWLQQIIFMHMDVVKISFRNALSFVISYLTTDFISGLVHIYLDHSAITNDGSVLDAQRKGFRHHHYHVKEKLLRPSYEPHYEMNYLFPYTIILTFVARAIPHNDIRAFLVYFAIMVSLFQACHLYAHARIYMDTHDKAKVPSFLCFLQDSHIILNHQHHQQHHTHPEFAINFAIFHGHTNWLLNSFYNYISVLEIN